MRFAMGLAGLSLAAVVGTCAFDATAAAPMSAHSKSCWDRADKQGLKGKDRTAFHTTCVRGALAPTKPTGPAPEHLSSQVITAPSGSDRTVRSKQCSDEADRRGLKEGKRDGFRLSCIASAAPVGAIGSRQQQPAPTPAKPKLDSLTATPPQGAGAATSAGAMSKPK